MIPLFRVPMSVQAPGAVAEVVASGQVGQGARVARFEAELAARIGNPGWRP
ncbi:hypothetical protein V2I01_33065 [Micromonospora sp. BRA006-A]|nr:hypothetical protein [Micromonospora sp. BRA006-A]